MESIPYLIHSLSSLHVGRGSDPGVIDLPIARMKATGIPFLPGSSIKGVLRAALDNDEDTKRLNAVFGSPARDPEMTAGALVVGDARLLMLPVRSFRGTFFWVTSPLLLALAKRDLNRPQMSVPSLKVGSAVVASEAEAHIHNNKLYLEDIDLDANVGDLKEWTSIMNSILPEGDFFSKRFAVVHDDVMNFLWETGTQVDARIRINAETRTVDKGALWLEESLPAETLLLGLLSAERARSSIEMQPHEVLDYALTGERHLQFGGKASTGRGRCRMLKPEVAGGASV